MSPVDVRAIALLSLALGAALGYSLRVQKRTSDDVQEKDWSVSTQDPKSPDEKSIRLVVQRFRKASLVVEESEIVTVGKSTPLLSSTEANNYSGILVYASFAKSATNEKVMQAAKTIMNLPVLTRGVWGDGLDTVGVLDMAGTDGVAVLLVPQANLICKVRSQGRSIQYHGQIDKAVGQCLYEYFVDCVRANALEHQCTSRGDAIPSWLAEFGKPGRVDASLPPNQLFRDVSQYSSWDALGIPQCDQNGVPWTKSALKKLRKQYDSQKKRHEKYLKTASSGDAKATFSDKSWSALDPSFIHVVSGSFGMRQGLEMLSDMGPFCHVLDL